MFQIKTHMMFVLSDFKITSFKHCMHKCIRYFILLYAVHLIGLVFLKSHFLCYCMAIFLFLNSYLKNGWIKCDSWKNVLKNWSFLLINTDIVIFQFYWTLSVQRNAVYWNKTRSRWANIHRAIWVGHGLSKYVLDEPW